MKKLFSIYFIFISISIFPQQFSVMTYNIRCGGCDNNNSNNWDSRKELLLAVIKKHNPELIGFQEMIPMQLDYLKTNLAGYSCYGTGREADGGGEGCYIFYKKDLFVIDSLNSGTKWYSSTPDIPGSNDMGDLYKRIITFARLKTMNTGKYFYHFNTHLTYVDSIQVRYIDFLTQVIKARKFDEPFILTGDFNADETSPAITKIKQSFVDKKLVDTYREVSPDNVISTFNYFSGKRDGKKIDYIFIEGNRFKAVLAGCDSTSINGKFPSDHNSVNAKIEFK
jgi:endonuclease/exonuclease/phosphatase family metal-dependent hydrolase